MKSLIPWRAANGDPWQEMRKEMDAVMRRFFWPIPEEAEVPESAVWMPRVDVEETEKAFVVKADVPGVEPKDVEVTVREGVLILKGEKQEKREEKEKNFHRLERFVGKFYREVPLPPGADEENVSATSTKGVLTVTVPKKATAQPKKIAVKPQE